MKSRGTRMEWVTSRTGLSDTVVDPFGGFVGVFQSTPRAVRNLFW